MTQRRTARDAADREAVLALLAKGGTMEQVADAIMERMADRSRQERRTLQDTARNAYQEGFLTGRLVPKYARYTIQIWRTSMAYDRLNPKKRDGEVDAHFARYNDN